MKRIMMTILHMSAACAVCCLMLYGTARAGEKAAEKRDEITNCIAVLHPTQGNKTCGVVFFTEGEEGVTIWAHIYNLTPGAHGFHIHEYGNCAAPDATSAGGHFNPYHQPHGGPDAEKRHVGDLGNIKADKNGYATYERTDKQIKLTGPNSILGRAVIVHAKEDDFTTQPTGAAGARVACGVVAIDRYTD